MPSNHSTRVHPPTHCTPVGGRRPLVREGFTHVLRRVREAPPALHVASPLPLAEILLVLRRCCHYGCGRCRVRMSEIRIAARAEHSGALGLCKFRKNCEWRTRARKAAIAVARARQGLEDARHDVVWARYKRTNGGCKRSAARLTRRPSNPVAVTCGPNRGSAAPVPRPGGFLVHVPVEELWDGAYTEACPPLWPRRPISTGFKKG